MMTRLLKESCLFETDYLIWCLKFGAPEKNSEGVFIHWIVERIYPVMNAQLFVGCSYYVQFVLLLYVHYTHTHIYQVHFRRSSRSLFLSMVLIYFWAWEPTRFVTRGQFRVLLLPPPPPYTRLIVIHFFFFLTPFLFLVFCFFYFLSHESSSRSLNPS